MTPRVTARACIQTDMDGHDDVTDRQENERFPGEDDRPVAGDWNPQGNPREDLEHFLNPVPWPQCGRRKDETNDDRD
jgi:hypothetical protein